MSRRSFRRAPGSPVKRRGAYRPTQGRALIIDLRNDASIDDIDAYIKDANLGWANSLIYKVTFRYLLIPRAYSRRQFVEMAASSRFGGAGISESGVGFEITLRK